MNIGNCSWILCYQQLPLIRTVSTSGKYPQGKYVQLNYPTATDIEILQHPDLPFSHFAIRLPTSPTATQLLHAYNTLYQAAADSVDAFTASTDSTGFSLHATNDGSLPISYNLALTTSGMAIVPRRSEGSMLKRDNGTEIGFVQLNGTTLGGTMLVKYLELWEALRARPDKLDDILRDIGIPKGAMRFGEMN
jgi:ATP adenylyltransferase